MIFGNDIRELNGLAAGAAGGSNMRLVLPPPTVSRLTEEFSVILVPEAEPRNRHGNPGRKEAYLFDLDVRVKPEHYGFCKIGGVIW